MTQPLAGKQILIVEDEPVFRSLMHTWLASLGATIVQAEDGVDALQKMAESKPDLMICDISMPRMNGLQLVEHVRNQGEQLPILMISATENMADIAKALRLGVQDILLKPVKDFDRLRETVYACLYPNMFNSRVEEEERLFEDWDALVSDPSAASRLLQELQPPVQQEIRTAVFTIGSLSPSISPVSCSTLRRYQKTIWRFIVWTSRERVIMGFLLLYYCAPFSMACCRSSLLIRDSVYRRWGACLNRSINYCVRLTCRGNFHYW